MSDTPPFTSATENRQWSDLHDQIQDWLAGYADGELDEHHTTLVEAHLAGCEACRHDVERQRMLSERLQEIPAPRLSPAFAKRLDDTFASAQASNKRPIGHRPLTGLKHWLARLSPSAVIGGGGWAVAMVLAAMLLVPNLAPDRSNQIAVANHIPMVSDVLADYQRAVGNDLPTPSRDADLSPPMPWPNGRVLARWTTSVGGEPAEAYAVRLGNSLIVQYQISERVFFRNPDVRQAVARAGDFRTRDNELEVIGVPMQASGLLVVAPSGNLPPIDKSAMSAS